MADLHREIKTAPSRRIASLFLVKLEEPRRLLLRLLWTETQALSHRRCSTFLLPWRRRRRLSTGQQTGGLWTHALRCHLDSHIKSRSVWHCYYFRVNTLCHKMRAGDFLFCASAWKSNLRTEPYYSTEFKWCHWERGSKDTLVTSVCQPAALKWGLNNLIKQPRWGAIDNKLLKISNLITKRQSSVMCSI